MTYVTGRTSNGDHCAIGVMMLADGEEKDELINQLINDKGVCRSALATLGLLKSFEFTCRVCRSKLIMNVAINNHSPLLLREENISI